MHLTETCDGDMPHVITNVETTIAPQPDVVMTEPIHKSLSEKELLPNEHMVVAGYVDSELLVTSQTDYQVELVGPVNSNVHWQAKDENAYSMDSFDINWEAKTATCPQGQTSTRWIPAKDKNGNDVILVRFSRPGCRLCESRSRCTRAKTESRSLTLRLIDQLIQLSPNRKNPQRNIPRPRMMAPCSRFLLRLYHR